MNKALEAWEIIKSAPTIYAGCTSDIYTRYPTECKIIEESLKEYAGFQIVFKLSNRDEGKKNYFRLKALKIIKTKEVDWFSIKYTASFDRYNYRMKNSGFAYAHRLLTKEEYELLREVLSW